MDLLKSELETGQLDGAVPMKTDFLLMKYLPAFVGSHLLLAVVRGTLNLSPSWQGCKMMISVRCTGFSEKAGANQFASVASDIP